MSKRKEICEVFTPRMSEVNSDMYVTRETLEKNLKRAIKRNTHSIIFGESGSGKSWLYKKVLNDVKTPFVIANCANASRLGSLTDEIHNCIFKEGQAIKTGFDESKKAGVNGGFLNAGLGHKGHYSMVSDEKLLSAFKEFDIQFSGRKLIVLDNFELMLDSKELMDELADLIILLDDSRYAQYNITFLIVGIPNNLLQYFSSTKNLDSVSNRLFEMDEVKGLSREETLNVVKKGFDLLDILIEHGIFEQEMYNHVYEVTLGIPQRVHEYCECLAYGIEDNNWSYDPALLDKADGEWLNQSLRQSYQVIELHLNSRDTKVARRNQVIYCIGKLACHSFDSTDIDEVIRKEFQSTVPKTNMGIGTILSELSSGDNPILLRGSKLNSYTIKDPRFLMCIRVVLKKDTLKEKVIKKSFSIVN